VCSSACFALFYVFRWFGLAWAVFISEAVGTYYALDEFSLVSLILAEKWYGRLLRFFSE
jgi:hypothetical protein